MESDLADSELARLIAGNEQPNEFAEVALYRRFAPRIELYGLRHLGSRSSAEDLVQQVMLRVLQAIRAGHLENPARLSSFVLGTCRNTTWDMRRADQRLHRLARVVPLPQTDASPPSLTERDVTCLLQCLARLMDREATVIRQSFWEDRDPEEIAARLGLSTGNVRVIRHRALAKLANCVKPEYAS